MPRIGKAELTVYILGIWDEDNFLKDIIQNVSIYLILFQPDFIFLYISLYFILFFFFSEFKNAFLALSASYRYGNGMYDSCTY